MVSFADSSTGVQRNGPTCMPPTRHELGYAYCATGTSYLNVTGKCA